MYGGWNEATVEAAKGMPSLRHNFHKSLAGYMKADGAGYGERLCLPVLFKYLTGGWIRMTLDSLRGTAAPLKISYCSIILSN